MTDKRRLVVVGNGMAGARFVEELLARGGHELFSISVFGEESHGNYNRILLSGVLAGTHDPKDIFINPLSWYSANRIRLHAGVRAVAIERGSRRVRGADSVTEPYDTLVLATGSTPLIPRIAGLHGPAQAFKPGLFVFRTIDDCDAILEFAAKARSAAVIGGGLLGLEAARGLLARGLRVHVIHLMSRLMETQLDAEAAAILCHQLEAMGLVVHFEKTTTAIIGDACVTGLAFSDGSSLECDLVVIAAGIRPNVELAVKAGLRVDRGIVVGDDLACLGASGVYAIGECAQHRGRLYGLVAPLWEQAACLADRLTHRNPEATYHGSRLSTKLKVMGVDVAVMGEKEPAEDDDEVVTYSDASRGIYKKLIVRKNRIAGTIVLGDGAVVPSLLSAFTEDTPLTANRSEVLFPPAGDSRSSRGQAELASDRLPDSARICNCNDVSKREIIEAVLGGARSLQAVCELTRAGTGCRSCRPEVQAILDAACNQLGASQSERVISPPPPGVERIEAVGANKIERYKAEKDGLDILEDVPRLARKGWEAIPDADRERLKWAGVFFRRQTPGRFMMRIRIPNGISSSAQFRAIAEASRAFGAEFVDITTRQQIQLRGFEIGAVEEIWRRLEAVGLGSLQTGMDNVRNVVGCPAAGLTPHELFDASPIAREFTSLFLRNKAYTNLPRKFNVAITACLQNCVEAEGQDIALTPALQQEAHGFNVAVGGKMGSGGYRVATPLDVFVPPDEAAALCGQITLIFRDHGSRVARSRARLAFLVEEWGAARFRRELERRLGHALLCAGRDARSRQKTDHIGIVSQRQPGFSSVGLSVPVGRITIQHVSEVARLADDYGSGDIRISVGQNLIVANVPNDRLAGLSDEPLLEVLSPNPSGPMRGLVSCTGIDYCHFALVETKELALKTAKHLEQTVGRNRRLTMHWSGCPAGCGNHAAADIGLLGKNIRVNGQVIEAVDVFVGGSAGPDAKPGTRMLEDIPCDDLPHVLERLIPYLPARKSKVVEGAAQITDRSDAGVRPGKADY